MGVQVVGAVRCIGGFDRAPGVDSTTKRQEEVRVADASVEAAKIFPNPIIMEFQLSKENFIVVNFTASINGRIIELSAVILDNELKFAETMSVLVREFYLDRKHHPLATPSGTVRHRRQLLQRRYEIYDQMLCEGKLGLASAKAINRWIDKMKSLYSPVFVSSNISTVQLSAGISGINLADFAAEIDLSAHVAQIPDSVCANLILGDSRGIFEKLRSGKLDSTDEFDLASAKSMSHDVPLLRILRYHDIGTYIAPFG